MHQNRYWLHITLFVVTFVSTGLTTSLTFIGRTEAWASSSALITVIGFPFSVAMLQDALIFALCLLFFLTAHEFGHYFAARASGVKTSLPYYIPAPLIGVGTMGAVISIREPLRTSRKVFDIGVAGPVAGFVVALPMLVYAMASIPPPEYLFSVGGHEALHSYIDAFGSFPAVPLEEDGGSRLTVGNTPLYWGLSQLFEDIPPMYEMYHYPVLFAAWLGLFFTALNLMPVGQLDGGHIVYSLLGPKWHLSISQGFVMVLLTSMAIGAAEDGPAIIETILPQSMASSTLTQEIITWIVLALILQLFLRRVFRDDGRWVIPAAVTILIIAMTGRLYGGFIAEIGYSGWLLWCILLVFLIKVNHPPVTKPEPLSARRKILGIAALVVFVLCFSFKPLYFV